MHANPLFALLHLLMLIKTYANSICEFGTQSNSQSKSVYYKDFIFSDILRSIPCRVFRSDL